MLTSKEKLKAIRNKDKMLAIWLWHEETLASMQARIRSLKKGE